MGKDQELLQAVKTEDLLTAQRLLQRPRPGKASHGRPGVAAGCSSGLTEERGALSGRERDRADCGGTEGTWGRTRSCSRP
ncbi:putative caskin-1-like [Scophthalmus maximus]|uniref:Putative caskin-1-like n=1 Tax=Scophthalmus maximus TaxID=52904 RepID=A0A2U9BNY0_SCOMX|nr:putative caskin-1-like [Scophthalmus maximus]